MTTIGPCPAPPVSRHRQRPSSSAACLGDVYGLLGERLSGAAPEVADPAAGVLTDDLVRRIFAESQPAHRKMLEFLASRPDEWMYSEDVAAALGLPHGQASLAGMLGAFGRRAKHRY